MQKTEDIHKLLQEQALSLASSEQFATSDFWHNSTVSKKSHLTCGQFNQNVHSLQDELLQALDKSCNQEERQRLITLYNKPCFILKHLPLRTPSRVSDGANYQRRDALMYILCDQGTLFHYGDEWYRAHIRGNKGIPTRYHPKKSEVSSNTPTFPECNLAGASDMEILLLIMRRAFHMRQTTASNRSTYRWLLQNGIPADSLSALTWDDIKGTTGETLVTSLLTGTGLDTSNNQALRIVCFVFQNMINTLDDVEFPEDRMLHSPVDSARIQHFDCFKHRLAQLEELSKNATLKPKKSKHSSPLNLPQLAALNLTRTILQSSSYYRIYVYSSITPMQKLDVTTSITSEFSQKSLLSQHLPPSIFG